MFNNLLRQEATRERLVGANNKQEYSASTITFKCSMQHLQMEDVLEADGRFNKQGVMYCDYGTDVISEDRITCEGIIYIVNKGGVSNFKMGRLSLCKVLVTEV